MFASNSFFPLCLLFPALTFSPFICFLCASPFHSHVSHLSIYFHTFPSISSRFPFSINNFPLQITSHTHHVTLWTFCYHWPSTSFILASFRIIPSFSSFLSASFRYLVLVHPFPNLHITSKPLLSLHFRHFQTNFPPYLSFISTTSTFPPSIILSSFILLPHFTSL